MFILVPGAEPALVAGRQRAAQRARESRTYRLELRRLGLRIRSLRAEHKLTIERAAEKMDLDPTHLAKIEAGTINVSFVTLVRLARGLGLSVPQLFVSH